MAFKNITSNWNFNQKDSMLSQGNAESIAEEFKKKDLRLSLSLVRKTCSSWQTLAARVGSLDLSQ